MNNFIQVDNKIQITQMGLIISEDLNFDQWSELGVKLGHAARISMFLIGDWLNYGQDRWNGGRRFEKMDAEQFQKYRSAMQMTGLEFDSLKKASQVARRIPIQERNSNLTFTHHRLLSNIPDDDKLRKWIRKTDVGNVSTRRLRASLIADRFVSERELNQPKVKGIKTHLLWVNRLTQWWVKEKASPKYENLTKEQLESTLVDLEPVIGIIDELRRKIDNTSSFID